MTRVLARDVRVCWRVMCVCVGASAFFLLVRLQLLWSDSS